jgi:molecular chaperone GrpE
VARRSVRAHYFLDLNALGQYFLGKSCITYDYVEDLVSDKNAAPETSDESIPDATNDLNNAGAEAAGSVVDTEAEVQASQAAGDGSVAFAELESELAQSLETIKALEQEKAALSREVSDLKDQFLRNRAEAENTRKRLQRDKDDAVQFANKQLLLDITGIIDDFERAIKSSEAAKDYDSFHGGISLIEKQFITLLENKWGIKRFDAAGEDFDPSRHEAVTAEPKADLPPQSIIEVYQKGYMLHDKVLRTAKVKVSLPG